MQQVHRQRRSAGPTSGRQRSMQVHCRKPSLTGSPAARGKQAAVASKGKESNLLTVGLVNVLTEALRVLGVGRQQFEAIAAAPPARPLRRGEVGELMGRVRKDYGRAYFVTGVIDTSIYEEDCYFADPTVAFTGLSLWQRNLQLLVPFLERPSIRLLSMERKGRDPGSGCELLRAEWELSTLLKLPWRPLIALRGATEYTLNDDANKIARHIEYWSISGTEALLQLFRPAPKDYAPAASGSARQGR